MLRKLLGLGILVFCLVLSGNAFSEEAKMGFINMRKVFYEYQKTKDFNQELEKEDEKVKKEIEKRTQGIRKLRDEIDLLSEAAKAKKEPSLRAKIKELDEYRKEKIEEFIKKKDEMFKDIREDILNTSTEYAKKNGYTMVFDKAVFVFAEQNYDLTDDIIKILNK